MTINNAANRPLFERMGDVPDVSGALQNYYQRMMFTPIAKIVQGFQVQETGNPIYGRGVIQPFTERQLMLKPEGERAWTWFLMHAEPTLLLQVDDVVLYLGIQTRVMSRKLFGNYGYVEYHLVQDWTGAGPS